MRRLPDLVTLRAAIWTWRNLARARSRLAHETITTVKVNAPPSLPPHAGRGVREALRRANASCLEAALIRQTWLASQGESRDLVIGVAGPATTFRAHAWLEGDAPRESEGYTELLRLPPRVGDR